MYGEHWFHDGRLEDTIRRVGIFMRKFNAERDARLRFARWRARRDRARWTSLADMPPSEREESLL